MWQLISLNLFVHTVFCILGSGVEEGPKGLMNGLPANSVTSPLNFVVLPQENLNQINNEHKNAKQEKRINETPSAANSFTLAI